MEDMIEGMKHTREVLSKPSLAKIVSEELLQEKKIKSDEDLKESVRKSCTNRSSSCIYLRNGFQ